MLLLIYMYCVRCHVIPYKKTYERTCRFFLPYTTFCFKTLKSILEWSLWSKLLQVIIWRVGTEAGVIESSTERLIRRVLAFGALGSSLTSLAFWTYYVYDLDSDWQKDKPGLTIFTVISPILVSIYWWENFVPQVRLNHYIQRFFCIKMKYTYYLRKILRDIE
jgi:hypothetical protein